VNQFIGLGPTAGGNSYFTRHNVSGSSVHKSGAHDEIKFSVLNLPFPSRELLESSVRRRRCLRHLHPRSHSFYQIRPCPSVSTSSSTASTRMCNFPALMKPTQSDRVALHGDLGRAPSRTAGNLGHRHLADGPRVHLADGRRGQLTDGRRGQIADGRHDHLPWRVDGRKSWARPPRGRPPHRWPAWQQASASSGISTTNLCYI